MKTKTARSEYTIYSGEGTGAGTPELVKMTMLGLKRRLTSERCGGDRFAFAHDANGDRVDA